MSIFLEIAWLVPFIPFLGAFLILLLLFCFNRTMNRLTKPVSFLLISCVGLSTLLSLILFQAHLEGNIIDWHLIVFGRPFDFGFYLDNISAIASLIAGLIILIVMISSYYWMDRKNGYVGYFAFLGLLSSAIFSFILSGDLFHRLL